MVRALLSFYQNIFIEWNVGTESALKICNLIKGKPLIAQLMSNEVNAISPISLESCNEQKKREILHNARALCKVYR